MSALPPESLVDLEKESSVIDENAIRESIEVRALAAMAA
jgi:hypothetical protein